MKTNGTKKAIASELSDYAHGWNAMMMQIWKDRIGMMHAIDTRRLFDSVSAQTPNIQGLSASFEFRFVTYGVYVDAGVGNGYKRGNGGNLQFLGKGYRSLQGLGKAREKRPWFSRSMAISQRVLAERYLQAVGDEFAGVFNSLDK